MPINIIILQYIFKLLSKLIMVLTELKYNIVTHEGKASHICSTAGFYFLHYAINYLI